MRRRKGIVIVYTGDGKGKTTAAFGMAFRALGRGFKVSIIQFIKGKWMTGERKFAESLDDVDLDVMGKGFTWESPDLNQDKQAARAAWEKGRDVILADSHKIVILDEITHAINYGFIEAEDVISTLRKKPEGVTVVLTGRNAPEKLCEIADLVTEMKMLKHPYDSGHKALLGVDF